MIFSGNDFEFKGNLTIYAAYLVTLSGVLVAASRRFVIGTRVLLAADLVLRKETREISCNGAMLHEQLLSKLMSESRLKRKNSNSGSHEDPEEKRGKEMCDSMDSLKLEKEFSLLLWIQAFSGDGDGLLKVIGSDCVYARDLFLKTGDTRSS